ncbi:MAG: hypothetical protein NC132_06535 [Corallococcus sp.]|nr:hypothetical protein [Corallococcus sp.]MCM1395741.1 hypothetical protein [Corallococcus sp.]
MNEKYAQLERALILAKEAAAFVVCDDGGTCNFDSPTLNWKNMGYSKDMVKLIIRKVGLHYWEPSDSLWNGTMIICGATCGQGNRRTAMAETFSQVLQSNNISSGVYYQVD